MIRKINLTAIASVAAGLSASGVLLAARPNTPLAALVNHSFPYDESQVTETATVTLENAAALTLDEGDSGHSDLMDREAQKVGDAIVKHCQFARTVVLPIIGKTYADIREVVETAGPIPYNVEQVWLHEAVTSALVQSLIERYQGNTNVTAPAQTSVADRTEAELTELIQTGSQSYDAILADLLSRVNLTEIYQRYFVTHQDVDRVSENGYVNIRFSTLPMAANETLLVHLLARALMDHPHEGTRQSLITYRNGMAGYVEATGCALLLMLQRWDRFQKTSQLILQQASTGGDQKNIYVYGPTYKQFLEKGGDAEAIIGAVVSSQRHLKYLSEFTEALPKLKMAYVNWLSRQDNARLANTGTLIRQAAAKAVTQAINDLTDEQNVCGCGKEDMHRKAVELLGLISESEWLKAPYQALRVVVCGAMFPRSNAFRILSLIDEQTEKHGIDDVRVAAYHAIKTLLVEHFLTQVIKVN